MEKKRQLSKFFEKSKLCTLEQFLEAVKTGKANEIERLNYLDSYLETKDKNGETPLHWAAYNGHEGVVKLLLAEKANLEAKTNDGKTPLHWAASCGHEGVVKLLLAEKANLEAKANSGTTPLHCGFLRPRGRGQAAVGRKSQSGS